MADTPNKPTAAQARRMRSAARFYAVQALFQMEASGQTVDQVRVEFENHRIGVETEGETWVDADIAYFRKLVDMAVDDQGRIDQLTDRALVAKWPIARIDPAREREQAASLKSFRASRDTAAVAERLDAIKVAARGSENLMPHLISGVKAGLTVGEISGALREIWGEYRESLVL